MEEHFENAELISLKKDLLNSLSVEKHKKDSSFIKAYSFHGHVLNFYSNDTNFANSVLNYLPSKWIIENNSIEETDLFIYLDNSWDQDWDYEVNPNCLIDHKGNLETAIQRDFLGIDNGSEVLLSLTALHADGIFNSLRWLLPRRMLSLDTFLLHSSCIIDNGKAFFFLGHSGAGKSTVATLSGERIVLGDDMNVMRFDGSRAYAKAGGLGGLSFSNTDFEKEFEVQGFYWLEQSDKNSVTKIGASIGATKLLASLANVFWEKMDDGNREKLLDLALEVSSKVNFYKLEFQKDEEFWKYVTKG